MKISATELRQNLYKILDAVIATGEPVEIDRKGGLVRIVREPRPSIWEALEVHEVINGDLEVDWTAEWDGESELGRE